MNYNRPLVRSSFLVAFGASIVIALFAGRALADGAYQRTDDRKKTIVWNNDPQPGDAAEWTGTRDSEGYAEGPGTLTWLRAQKAFATGSNIWGTKKVPISRLTGTMVHGKFVGGVTTIDHGKTYHAKYVDGQRKGNWSLGPVVAKATSVEPAAESGEPKTPPKIIAAQKVETPAEPKVSEEAEPEPPTEGPDEVSGSTAEASASRSTLNKGRSGSDQPSTPLIAQASEADESATPRQQPVTRKSALAPGAVRAIEQPARTTEKKSEKPKEVKVTKTPKIEKPKAEPKVVEREAESPAEGPLSAGAGKSETPNPKSKTETPSQPSIDADAARTKIPPLAEEKPADDSIRTLTGPPASLRIKPAAAPPAASTPEPGISIAPASSASAEPKLNAVQAMDIADIEARTKGYDLGEYQLPKAEYNAADDTWSVSYIARDKDKKTNGLHVTIQDKSGKAEVKK
ncbi:MAG TPA: hypothetical protein VLK27_05165 [Chthoniobacterales bacterium]|nr:hypothetical protein [Chthoniobacterales bacterium]